MTEDYYVTQMIKIIQPILEDATGEDESLLASQCAKALRSESYIQHSGIGGPMEYYKSVGIW